MTTEIDLTTLTSGNEAWSAGEAAFVAGNPAPTAPEKTFTISRSSLISTDNGARLWVEVRQSTAWGGAPSNAKFVLCTHGLEQSADMQPEEIQALIDQLSLKLKEYEAAAAYRAQFEAYQNEKSHWSEKKNEAAAATRAAWFALQKTLQKAPKPDDYTTDEIEVEDYDEESYDDSDDDL